MGITSSVSTVKKIPVLEKKHIIDINDFNYEIKSESIKQNLLFDIRSNEEYDINYLFKEIKLINDKNNINIINKITLKKISIPIKFELKFEIPGLIPIIKSINPYNVNFNNEKLQIDETIILYETLIPDEYKTSSDLINEYYHNYGIYFLENKINPIFNDVILDNSTDDDNIIQINENDLSYIFYINNFNAYKKYLKNECSIKEDKKIGDYIMFYNSNQKNAFYIKIKGMKKFRDYFKYKIIHPMLNIEPKEMKLKIFNIIPQNKVSEKSKTEAMLNFLVKINYYTIKKIKH